MASSFKSTSSMVWLGRKKEKKILELCKSHLGNVVETVIAMHKAFQLFSSLNREGAKKMFDEAFKHERKADEIKRNILGELSKGLFHPINRDEIIRLIMTVDDIAAYAKASSRKLEFIDPSTLTESLRETLRVFADNLLKISEEVKIAFKALTENPKQAIEASQRVESLEERIDDFRVEFVIPEFLSWCKNSNDVGVALILKEILDGMENLADRCEDVADVIRSIALSYI
ncbi:hypothetical protein DRO51_00905 [Candidatus Bathyarchaeota archaeon]|nr:MAG: hypothetical protein DRO51_00905 [Candidatus Bathyarchaeota archaeon]